MNFRTSGRPDVLGNKNVNQHLTTKCSKLCKTWKSHICLFMLYSIVKAILCKAGQNWKFGWWREQVDIITCVSTWLQWNTASSHALINAVYVRIHKAADRLPNTTASHVCTTYAQLTHSCWHRKMSNKAYHYNNCKEPISVHDLHLLLHALPKAFNALTDCAVTIKYSRPITESPIMWLSWQYKFIFCYFFHYGHYHCN